MIERREFHKILGLLAAAYPRFELSAETITAYHGLLRDLDTNLVKAATLQLASSSKWFPTASEIRVTAFELVEREGGVPDAWEAWQAVVREVGRVGYVGAPKFGHPAIDTTVKSIGGWRSICLSTNVVADRARFVQAYEATLRRERAEMRMLPEVRELTARLMVSGRRALSNGSVDVVGGRDDGRDDGREENVDLPSTFSRGLV